MTSRHEIEVATVPVDGAPDWADQWVARLLDSIPSKAGARKAIRRGEIAIDGALTVHPCVVGPGQRIARLEPEGRAPRVFPIPLSVVFEDDGIAAVVKPPGYPVNGPWHRTVEHALPHALAPSTASDALRWPRPAHRLDGPTGGLLLCAKRASTLAALNLAFQERRVDKTYRAIACGRLEGEGTVTGPLDGRDAETRWRAIGHGRALRCDWLTTVDLWPRTGRTHQLRRHLSGLGHPILGDAEYGIDGWILRGKGLFLWAIRLELAHPVTGEALTLAIDPPPKFGGLLAREARRWAQHRDGDGGLERAL